MRLPRVRFTVRRMLASVAVVATILAGVAAERRQRLLSTAEYHGSRAMALLGESQAEEHFAAMVAGEVPGEILTFLEPDHDADRHRTRALVYADRAAYHALMSQKYKRAARYPWLPLSPDPPPP